MQRLETMKSVTEGVCNLNGGHCHDRFCHVYENLTIKTDASLGITK